METARALSGQEAPGNVIGCTDCKRFPVAGGGQNLHLPLATAQGKTVFFFKQNGDWLDFILHFILHGEKDRNTIPE